MAKWFCEGYEKQAKKEEKEAKDIVNAINSDALKALCARYDNKTGEYPRHEHEGAAVFTFFEKLKADVGNGKEKQEVEKR
ncbi:hypothetical protein KA005_55870 [bacterium]|nr:hypothetical protein [bacterium]